ncbi:MAG: hypothetical protein OER98_00845 [Gammaproteobacteria bacterium]|nr:hypothetical protein [Gammaproteobacteria bacterium]
MNKLLTMIFSAALIAACAAPVSNERNEKTVFITKSSFPSDMGGLAGADAKCQAEADDPASIVPAGTYLPWLSDGTNSPDTRFTKSSHPYVLPDGTKIAENYTDLTDGSILHAINVDATGALVLGSQHFWTGTMTDGKADHQFVANVKRNSCNAWNGTTVYLAIATIGVTNKKTGEWTNYRQGSCNSLARPKRRLTCFQQ